MAVGTLLLLPINPYQDGDKNLLSGVSGGNARGVPMFPWLFPLDSNYIHRRECPFDLWTLIVDKKKFKNQSVSTIV